MGDRQESNSSRAMTTARCAIALRDHGPATVSEIARGTALSRPTVEAALAALGERRLVVESDQRSRGGRGTGRPARRYEFSGSEQIVVGVDVGVHAVKVVVADLGGRGLAQIHRETGGTRQGPNRMRHVQEVIHQALARADVSTDQLVAMSAAVPGWIGPDRRLIVSRVLPDWEGIDIADHLTAEFGCPVTVDNDMRCAATAEHQLGAARLADDVLYFFAGHRLSMALILGGKVRRGHHGAAGEFGDLIYAGSRHDDGELEWTSAKTGAEVFRMAAAGDARAQEEVTSFANGLALGLATTIMAVDPDIVVVGGGLSRAGDVLLRPLRAAIHSAITIPVRPVIVSSELGAGSTVLGALVQAGRMATDRTLGVPNLPGPRFDIEWQASAGQAAAPANEPAAG